jgi:hypothetical protein
VLATKVVGMAVHVCGAHGTQEGSPFGRCVRDPMRTKSRRVSRDLDEHDRRKPDLNGVERVSSCRPRSHRLMPLTSPPQLSTRKDGAG